MLVAQGYWCAKATGFRTVIDLSAPVGSTSQSGQISRSAGDASRDVVPSQTLNRERTAGQPLSGSIPTDTIAIDDFSVLTEGANWILGRCHAGHRQHT